MLWVCCLAAVAAQAPSGEPRSAERIAAEVDAFVAPFVATNNFSGALLVARKGHIILEKGYGLADRDTRVLNTPATRFQIASVSKSFTAAAVFVLVQQGRVRLDAPVSTYLPDYPQGGRITIAHLLAHTSGIPDANQLPGYDERARVAQTLESVVGFFKDRPLEFEPGARYKYSNSNYNLLAAVIEKVSGQSYARFLDAAIFGPLAMHDTGHPPAGVVAGRHAVGYAPVGFDRLEPAPAIDWSIKTGNGSLYSTVGDLYRWDRALYGTSVVDATSKRQMFSDHEGVGYGWAVRPNRFGRRSLAIIGRSPGFAASLERFVDDDVCVVMVSNVYSSLTASMAEDVAAIVFGAPPSGLSLKNPPVVDVGQLDTFVGVYRLGPDFQFQPNLQVEVVRDGTRLLFRMNAVESYLIPQSPSTFVDRAYGGLVRFIGDAGRPAERLVWNFGRDYEARRVER